MSTCEASLSLPRASMSNMKRQTSWQEDIARNFSRLFLRSRSQCQEKTGGGDDDDTENGSNAKESELSSPGHGQTRQPTLDLSKPFQGSGGDRDGDVFADARASPLHPSPGLPACPLAPVSPSASLDAFFKKLGTLFHSATKAGDRPADPGQREASEVEPGPVGMTWVVVGSQEHRDPVDGPWEGAGARYPGQETECPFSPAEPSTLLSDGGPEESRPPDHLQEEQQSALNEDDHVTRPHGVAIGWPSWRVADERRRLELSCPPVVTYGTYRGLRGIQKMQRRFQAQTGFAAAEEEDQQCDGDSADPLPRRDETTGPASEIAMPAGAVDSCRRPASRASEMDAGLVADSSTTRGALCIPVLAVSENGSNQSALVQELELSLAATKDLATDPGSGSAAAPQSTAGKDPSDQLLCSRDLATEMPVCPGEHLRGKTWAVPLVNDGDTDAGASQAETLPTGGYLRDGASLVKAGSACENMRTFKLATQNEGAVSLFHDSQVSQCGTSPSCSREPEGGEDVMPADPDGDVSPSLLASTQNDLGESDSESILHTSGYPEGVSREEAFHSESKLLVACILKNALAALERIETSECEKRELQVASGTRNPVFSAEMDDSVDGRFQPTCLQEGSCLDQGDQDLFSIPMEQITSSRALMDASRSSQSSGYQSIVGSDTDIRISSALPGDPSSSLSSLDQRQRDQFLVDNQIPEPPSDIRGSLESRCRCNKEEMGTLTSGEVRPAVLGDDGENSSDVFNQKSKSVASSKVLLEKQCLDGDNGDIIQQDDSMTEQPENFSGIINMNNAGVDGISGDNDVTRLLSTSSGEALFSDDLHVAKECTESNRQFQNTPRSSEEHLPPGLNIVPQDFLKLGPESNKSVTIVENESVIVGLENKNDTEILDRKWERTDGHLSRRAVEAEMEEVSKTGIASTKSEFSHVSEELIDRCGFSNGGRSIDSTSSSVDVLHRPRSMLGSLEDTRGLSGQQDLSDTQSGRKDHLVQADSHFAPVSKAETDSTSGEEASMLIEPREENVGGEGENLPERETHALQLALSLSNEGRQQQSAVKTYNSDLPVELQQDAEILGQGAGVSFHNSVSGRTTGFNLLGRKVPPDLIHGGGRSEISGRHLHRLHEMDFSECESGFPIINEEEEMDAVFVNDTGVTLSPTSRRGKIYPFSLSPIYEEEGIREEACVEDLQEPVMEEDRHAMEQQASNVLSLLQSVSERLQSSAFSDSGQEGSEIPSALLRCPSWDCYGDEEETQPEGRAIPTPPLCGSREELRRRRSQHKQAGCLSSMDPFVSTTQTRQASPPQDGRKPTSAFTDITSTPFYDYLQCARSTEDRESAAFGCQKNGASSSSPKTNVINEESLRVIPRPTQIHIYSGVTFSGEHRVVHTDTETTAGMVLLHGASVRVVRGCWLLYRQSGYRGPCVALEEGDTVLTHTGALASPDDGPTAVAIGSIRRAVKDDGPPEIQLHQESLGMEVGNLGGNGDVHLLSLTVKSGCWLAYDGGDFTGNYAVLEAGRLLTAGSLGRPIISVRSLRPLRMGGLAVRKPMDSKMVVYERPCFQGHSVELDTSVLHVETLPGLQGAASLRVIGGVWVGYSEEGYRGRQYLLEEGEYPSFEELGVPHHAIHSLRTLLGDFIHPSVSLREGLDVPDPMETNILDMDVPDLEPVRPSRGTASICVVSGLWVAYSQRFFCGEQYILEKGVYPGVLDWGVHQGPPLSIRPISQAPWPSEDPKFLLRAYSLPQYRGESREYESEAASLDPTLSMSFRVIRGSWLLFEEEDCTGNQFVLCEGLYPDLISCGCVASSIKSLKPIPYSFSDPSISLYSLDSFEGLETVATTSVERLGNFFTQSVRVNSGTWVVYEYAGFKGCQMLLQPGDVAAWGRHIGWDTVGSLHPLPQPKVYVRLRSRALDSVLTAEGATMSLRPACDLGTQLWVFTEGILKSKVGKMCLSVVGGKALPGVRVALWPYQGWAHQKWSINENGTISSHLNHSLVLDVEGGSGLDRDHLVTSDFVADRMTQYWDIEVV